MLSMSASTSSHSENTPLPIGLRLMGSDFQGTNMKEYYLGVDLGGTKIAVCGSNYIDDKDGIMRFPSGFSVKSADVVKRLINSVDVYIGEKENGVLPKAIGFGLKDSVDFSEGIWNTCPSPDGFKKVAFGKLISDRYGVPVLVDNDVHAGTLAEMKYGTGIAYRNFLYINIGTGIAAGAVIEGKLMRGACNYAGEAGHFSVDPDGEYCDFCGQHGCIENIAGGKAIIRQAKKAIGGYPHSMLARIYSEKGAIYSSDVFSAADAGDEQAVIIAQRVLTGVEMLSCGLINMFNPEAVIYGGGVMSDGWLFSRLEKSVPKKIIPTNAAAIREFSLSRLGADHVGVLGAIALAAMTGK